MTTSGEVRLDGTAGLVPRSTSSTITVRCLGSFEGSERATCTLSSSDGSTDPIPQDAECWSDVVSDLDGADLLESYFSVLSGGSEAFFLRSLGRFTLRSSWRRIGERDRTEEQVFLAEGDVELEEELSSPVPLGGLCLFRNSYSEKVLTADGGQGANGH